MAVITGRDLLGRVKAIRTEFELEGYRESDWPILAADEVRFVSEAVAAVVAVDRYVAEDAVDLVEVKYEPLPVVTDPESALQPGSPLVHVSLPDNVLLHTRYSSGNVDEVFRAADYVFDERLRGGRLVPLPMECRGCLAEYDPAAESLTFWSSHQAPHVLRTWLAEFLGFPEHRVRVIVPDVGGGFGVKLLVHPEEIVTGYVSILLRRPVRWIEDRREYLLASPQARDQTHHIGLAFRADGTLLGIRDRVVVDVGAYSSFPVGAIMEPIVASKSVPGPYRSQAYAYDTYAVATNKPPVGAYRGVGRPVANYALEYMMDLAARRLGLDPADIRLRNLVQPGEFPYRTAGGATYDSGSYVESLQKALEAVDYPSLRREQARLRKEGRFLGIGISSLTEATAPPSVWFKSRGDYILAGYDTARVQMDAAGKVTLALGVSSQGQGHRTVFAQLVADELGVDIDDVGVIQGDTAVSPYGLGTWASRSAVLGGGAAILAARKLRDKLLRIAAARLEAAVQDLDLAAGKVSVRGAPGRWLRLDEIAKIALFMPYHLPPGEEPGLEALASFEAPGAAYSNTVHVVVLEADAETGQVAFRRYVIAEDCGTVINPMLVDGQVHGGTAQGIGQSLLEEIVYDQDGQSLTASLMDYLAPTALDVPPLELLHFASPSPLTVGGIKGMGEGSASAPPGAIACALADALGVAVPELPFTPRKLFEAVRSRAAMAFD
jgi:carbon-monoxide dehydrogenase large subunit